MNDERAVDREVFSPFVAGGFASAANGKEVESPWGGAPLPPCREASDEEIERAISAAADAAGMLASMAGGERSALLRRLLGEVEVRAGRLAHMITAEVGKPIALSEIEVQRARTTIRLGAEEAMRLAGEVVPFDDGAAGGGSLALTRRFPVGPVLAITPFNFPLNLLCHKLVPAIAAGCPVIAKPAPRAPRTALLLAEAAAAAGWPAGILSVLPIANEQAGRLAADPRLPMISFTGSALVGWNLRARHPKKKILLELGGNAGVVVDETADLERAAKLCAAGALAYAGQVCISVQRIFATKEIFPEFRDRLVKEFEKTSAGDPWNRDVRLGPMIDEASAKRVEEWVREAERSGATALVRSERKGNVLGPILLTRVPRGAKVVCEEVFGPVAVVEEAADFEDALARVDDSKYGLQAGVFTTRLDRARRAFERLRVGAVIVGDSPAFRYDGMPYGGVKESGTGREGVRYAMDEMTEMRLLVLR